VDESSDTKIRNAKPADKEIHHCRWPGPQRGGAAERYRAVALPLPFRQQAQEHVLRHVPDVGLKAAREKRDDAEKLLDKGQDPAAARKMMRSGPQSQPEIRD
jgi:hypothetical protein